MKSSFGDIKLDGEDYRIVIQSYKYRDIVDFSPRATTPGGSIVYNELDLYQPLLLSDWTHGFGFQWHIDAMGYLRTIGSIDTRQKGIVTLFTKETESDTDDAVKEGFTTFNDSLWSYGPGGLRKYSSGSWADSGSYGTVNYILSTGDYLFICVDDDRIRKMNTSDLHEDAGLDENADDYHWLIIYNGYIYAGKDGTNFVHFDSEPDLSLLEGDSTDPNRIIVGGGGIPTIGAIVYLTNLYISRADGLWQLGEDLVARRAIDFTDELSDSNFRFMVEHNGYLVFPVRDTLFQWNGARLSDITPPEITDAFPYTTYGTFDNGIVEGQWLFYTARTNEATYIESILCWDGKGHHRLKDAITDGVGSITAMGYDTVNNYLWYHLDITGDKTYYIPFQENSQFASTPFPKTETHSLITSRLDMGFRRIDKSMPSLRVGATNLDDGTYLDVYYQLDDSTTWVLWDSVKTNGVQELTGPGTARTREYKWIKLRIDFITDDANQTPVLEELVLKFLMRPEVFYGHSFEVNIADNLIFGQRESKKRGLDLINQLEATRNSKKPVEFIDIWGRKNWVYITAMNFRVVEEKVDEMGNKGKFDIIGSINVVEVVHAETET